MIGFMSSFRPNLSCGKKRSVCLAASATFFLKAAKVSIRYTTMERLSWTNAWQVSLNQLVLLYARYSDQPAPTSLKWTVKLSRAKVAQQSLQQSRMTFADEVWYLF